MKHLLFLVLLLVPNMDAHASTWHLDPDTWEVEVNGQKQGVMPLNFRWQTLSILDSNLSVKYQNTFNSDSKADLELVIPPSWVPFTVDVNGITVKRADLKLFPGNIYRTHVIPIHKELLGESNTITISSEGSRWFGGIRGEKIDILAADKASTDLGIKLRNFLLNDLHSPILVFSFFIFTFCCFLIKIRNYRRLEYFLILVYIACSIPYIGLATDIYHFLGFSYTFPFKFQQALQTAMWHSFIAFFLVAGSKHSKRTSNLLTGYHKIAAFYAFPFLMLIGAFFLPDKVFLQFSQVYFGLIALSSIATIFFLDLNRLLNFSFIAGVVIGFVGMHSELTGGNLYLFGYCCFAINLTGAIVTLRDVDKESKQNYMAQQFMQQFLPKSVFQDILDSISQGKSYEEIISHSQSKRNLTTILIDICDWGRLSSYEESKIPPGLVNKARMKVFGEIELIMKKYNLELIKTSGDNMKYCGGLAVHDLKNRDSMIAEEALRASLDVLESVHRINSDLREKLLPYVEIKICGSFGPTESGIEKYSSRGLFDTQGHHVNMAYRIDSPGHARGSYCYNSRWS